MKMNDEQFKNEVYRRRDAAIKSRKAKRRIIFSMVPAVFAVLLAVLSVDKFGIYDKSSEKEILDGDCPIIEETEEYSAYYGDEQLKSEAADWLVENALPNDMAVFDNFAGDALGTEIQSGNSNDTKSESVQIVLKYADREYRFILDDFGIYSCFEKRYIDGIDIESFRALIREEIK